MLVFAWIGAWIGLITAQANPPPAYVREGNRVIAEFDAYRERLDGFYSTLRKTIERDIPVLLPELKDPPPETIVYGYQLLPHIVENTVTEHKPVTSFSYSWTITRGYIDGEGIKLDRAEAEMKQASQASGVAKSALILSLISAYRSLFDDVRVIDQYIEYNRLWQRAIAEDRPRFDDMTKLYKLIQAADSGTAGSIRQMLGQPMIPSSIQVVTDEENHAVVLHVPVYTDIENDTFLAEAKAAIEKVWQAKDDAATYSVEIEIRKIPPAVLYTGAVMPNRGDHVDIRIHAARFPSDGVALTTGAEMTNAIVRRYVALGPGDISIRTFAHEFGHLLGFQDGYVRGYKDLGEYGFEIQELTSVFDDIMTSPRDGAVTAAHFKLIVEAVKQRAEATPPSSDNNN